jgi:hypothetical protein
VSGCLHRELDPTPLKYRSDLILLDVEGSPFLAIKDVKHAAAAREASTRSEA